MTVDLKVSILATTTLPFLPRERREGEVTLHRNFSKQRDRKRERRGVRGIRHR
jgi:hypothetical protein